MLMHTASQLAEVRLLHVSLCLQDRSIQNSRKVKVCRTTVGVHVFVVKIINITFIY